MRVKVLLAGGMANVEPGLSAVMEMIYKGFPPLYPTHI